jgi:hypothetical protein
LIDVVLGLEYARPVASVLVSLVIVLRSAARSRTALHLEILALRHQVAVLNRSRSPRLRLTVADRVLWAWLSQAWSGWRPALVLVKPDTVLAWLEDFATVADRRGNPDRTRSLASSIIAAS